MICKFCNKEIPEDSVYCPICGYRLAPRPQKAEQDGDKQSQTTIEEKLRESVTDKFTQNFDDDAYAFASDKERREYIKQYTDEVVSASKKQIYDSLKEEQKKKNRKRLKVALAVLISSVLLFGISAFSFYEGLNHSLDQMYAVTGKGMIIHRASCKRAKAISNKYKYFFHPSFQKNSVSYLTVLEESGYHYCGECFD